MAAIVQSNLLMLTSPHSPIFSPSLFFSLSALSCLPSTSFLSPLPLLSVFLPFPYSCFLPLSTVTQSPPHSSSSSLGKDSKSSSLTRGKSCSTMHVSTHKQPCFYIPLALPGLIPSPGNEGNIVSSPSPVSLGTI